MTRRVQTHPVNSRRPLILGHPQHDFAASVAGVEPLVRTADLAQVQQLLHQRANQAPFDQAPQLVEARPLACEEHAVERLVLPVEKREVPLPPRIVVSCPKGFVAGMLFTTVSPPTVSRT